MGLGGGAIGSLFVEIGAKTENLEAGLSRASSGLASVASHGSGLMGMAMGGFGMAAAGAVMNQLGGALSIAKGGIIGTNAAMQDSETAWKVMLGGSQQAKDHLKSLFDVAADTPNAFKDIEGASRVMHTFGGATLDTSTNLKMFGDAAAGTGNGIQEVSFWGSRLYGALESGKPIAMMTTRFQEMGIMSGTTANELQKMQKEGKSGDEIFKAFGDSLGKFGGLMHEQANNWNGAVSTFKDKLSLLSASASKPLFEMLNKDLVHVNDALSSPALSDFAGKLAGEVGSAISGTISYLGDLAKDAENFGKSLEPLVGKVTGFTTAFSDGFKTMGTGGLDAVLNGVEVAISKTFGTGGAGATISGFVGTIRDAYTKISNVDFASLFNQAKTGIESAWHAVEPFVLSVTKLYMAVSPLGAVLSPITGQYNVWSDIFTRLKPQLTAIVGGITGMSTSLSGGDWSSWATTLLSYGTQIINFLTPTKEKVTAVGDAFATFGGWLNSAKSTFDGVTDFLKTLAEGADKLGAAIMPALTASFTAMQPSLDLLQKNMGGVSGVTAQLAPLWEQIKNLGQALTPVLELVAGVVGGVLVTALGLLVSIVGGVVSGFAKALPDALNFASGIIQTVTAVIGTISTAITGVTNITKDLLSGNWSKAWTDAQAMVMGVADGINKIAMGLQNTVVAAIKGLVDGATGFISGFVDTAIGFFSTLYKVLVGASIVPDMVNAILGWFTTMKDKAGQAVSNMVDAVTGFFTGLYTTAAKGVADFVGGIIGKYTDLKDQASGLVDKLKIAVLGTFSDLVTTALLGFTGFVTDSVGKWTDLKDRASGVVDTLKTAISTTLIKMTADALIGLAQFVNDAVGKWDDLKTRATTAVDNLSSSVTGGLGKLVNDAKKHAADIGNGIIDGMVNAINHGLSSVLNAVGDLASKAIDATKKAFGQSSPSKAYYEIGENNMIGMDNAHKDGAAGVIGTMTGIASNVIAAARQSMAGIAYGGSSAPNLQLGSGSSGGPGAGQSVTVNINIKTDGQFLLSRDQADQLVRQIKPAFENAIRTTYR